MVSISVFSVLVTAVVLGTYETGADPMGCSDPEQRCIPIRRCPEVFDRIHKGEFSWNVTFRNEVKSKLCEPVERMDQKKHICCSKSDIKCRLNEQRGVCLLREECPRLKMTTEQRLMESAEQNVCYAHDSKKYFCCTDPYCVQHKKLCEKKEVLPLSIINPSLYPNCTSYSGSKGSFVPKELCSGQYWIIKRTRQQRVCCLLPEDPNQLFRHRNAAKLADIKCGPIFNGPKIEHGEFTKKGEFPWMAYLVYRSKELCSGTLIHPKYVLTAKHCLDVKPYSVRLGVHSIRENSSQVQEIRVNDTRRHSSRDIGLVLLANPASLDGYRVQPICLPVYESLRMYLPTNITITGWGQTDKLRRANVLMKANTKVLVNEPQCTMHHICTGGRTYNNHCPGDSGGPYQVTSKYGDKPRVVQYGVISHGPSNCRNPKDISRGVLVAYFMDWILDNMIF